MLLDRRELLRRTWMGGAGILLGGCAAGTLRQCQQQIQNRPTRRNVSTMAPNDPVLVAFRSAIQQMKALPSTNRLSWNYQASIHLNNCPHGNWLLLPWHRAYLFYFENICRKLSGMADFALPYWDWSTAPSMPTVYLDPTSALYDPTRLATASSVADPSMVGPAEISSILTEPNFLVFAGGSIAATAGQRTSSSSGPLESTPHNYIHNFVNGDMGAYMSPLDPIFWAHHSMIDRCWVDWNIVRDNPNSSDPAWTNRTFTEFCDENGNPITVSAIDTVLMPILSYQYDVPIGGSAASPGAQAMVDQSQRQQELAARVKPGASVRVDVLQQWSVSPPPVEIGRPVTVPVGVPVRTVAQSRGTGARTLLALDGTSMNHVGDFYVRVFVGKPDADANTPTNDPHLVASFAFFGHDHGASAPATGSFVFDATAALQRLGSTDEALALTLVLVPFANPKPATRTFSPGVVSLRAVRDTIVRQP
jgi:tyrosinase